MVVEVEGVVIDRIDWEGLMVFVGVAVREMREVVRSWCLISSGGGAAGKEEGVL